MLRTKSLLALGIATTCALAVWCSLIPPAKTASGQVAKGGAAVLEAPSIQLPPGVPEKVGQVLRFIDENGRAPSGFVGGRVFTNDGRGGEQVLPPVDADGEPIEYHEWDVNRRIPGKNRGTQRLITGSDGSAYYTGDHYQTFQTIRGLEAAGERGVAQAPRNVPELPPIVQLPEDATAKLNAVLSYIRVHGTAMPGYVGGREYQNRRSGGSEVLPKVDADNARIQYQEWDVNPRVPGKNRGTQRLITGSDGSAYYTEDHYRTFKRIR